MLNKVFPTPFAKWLCLAATTVLALAAGLDFVGRVARASQIWLAGGHLLTAGVALGLIAATATLARTPRRGVILLLFGLALGGLARWLRGAAGVAPDRPLIVAEWIAAGVLLSSWWRMRKGIADRASGIADRGSRIGDRD